MARLKLNPDPTFTLKVAVPVPSGTADVGFTFKYRDADETQKWIADTRDLEAVDVLLECVTGWDLADAFTRENVALLCKQYPGAPLATIEAYLRALTGVRQGN